MSIQKRTIRLPDRIELSPYLITQPCPPIPHPTYAQYSPATTLNNPHQKYMPVQFVNMHHQNQPIPHNNSNYIIDKRMYGNGNVNMYPEKGIVASRTPIKPGSPINQQHIMANINNYGNGRSQQIVADMSTRAHPQTNNNSIMNNNINMSSINSQQRAARVQFKYPPHKQPSTNMHIPNGRLSQIKQINQSNANSHVNSNLKPNLNNVEDNRSGPINSEDYGKASILVKDNDKKQEHGQPIKQQNKDIAKIQFSTITKQQQNTILPVVIPNRHAYTSTNVPQSQVQSDKNPQPPPQLNSQINKEQQTVNKSVETELQRNNLENLRNRSKKNINNYVYLLDREQRQDKTYVVDNVNDRQVNGNTANTQHKGHADSQAVLVQDNNHDGDINQDRESRIKYHNQHFDTMLQEYEKLRRYSQHQQGSHVNNGNNTQSNIDGIGNSNPNVNNNGNVNTDVVDKAQYKVQYNYSYNNGRQLPRIDKNSSDQAQSQVNSKVSKRSSIYKQKQNQTEQAQLPQHMKSKIKFNQANGFKQVPHSKTTNNNNNNKNDVNLRQAYRNSYNQHANANTNGNGIRQQSSYTIQGVPNIRSEMVSVSSQQLPLNGKWKEQNIQDYIRKCVHNQLSKQKQMQAYINRKKIIDNINSKIANRHSRQYEQECEEIAEASDEDNDDNHSSSNADDRTSRLKIRQLGFKLKQRDLQIKNLKNQVWLLRMKENQLMDVINKLKVTNQEQYAFIIKLTRQHQEV